MLLFQSLLSLDCGEPTYGRKDSPTTCYITCKHSAVLSAKEGISEYVARAGGKALGGVVDNAKQGGIDGFSLPCQKKREIRKVQVGGDNAEIL